MRRKRITIEREDLDHEVTTWGTKRLDNESFVKAWQSSQTIEDFLQYSIQDEDYCRSRATNLRRSGVNLKYLKARNNDIEDLNRLAHLYCC